MSDASAPSLKDRICEATDELRLARMARADYDILATHARALLVLRQEAERYAYGRVKTQITAVAVARLIRG